MLLRGLNPYRPFRLVLRAFLAPLPSFVSLLLYDWFLKSGEMPPKPKTSAKKTGKKKVLKTDQRNDEPPAAQTPKPASAGRVPPQATVDLSQTTPGRYGKLDGLDSSTRPGENALGTVYGAAAGGASNSGLAARARSSSFNPAQTRVASRSATRPPGNLGPWASAASTLRQRSPSPTDSEKAYSAQLQYAVDMAERVKWTDDDHVSPELMGILGLHMPSTVDKKPRRPATDPREEMTYIRQVREESPPAQIINLKDFNPLSTDRDREDSGSPMARSQGSDQGCGPGADLRAAARAAGYAGWRNIGFEPRAEFHGSGVGIEPGAGIHGSGQGLGPGADLYCSEQGVGPGTELRGSGLGVGPGADQWAAYQGAGSEGNEPARLPGAASANPVSSTSAERRSECPVKPFDFNLYYLALAHALPATRHKIRSLETAIKNSPPDNPEQAAKRKSWEMSPKKKLEYDLEGDRKALDAIKAQFDKEKTAQYMERIKKEYEPGCYIWPQETQELVSEAVDSIKPVIAVVDTLFTDMKHIVRQPIEAFAMEPYLRAYIFAMWEIANKFPQEARRSVKQLRINRPPPPGQDSPERRSDSSPQISDRGMSSLSLGPSTATKGAKRKSPDESKSRDPRLSQQATTTATDSSRSTVRRIGPVGVSARAQTSQNYSGHTEEDAAAALALTGLRNPAAEARTFPSSHKVDKDAGRQAQADLEVMLEYAKLAGVFESGDEARISARQRRSILRCLSTGKSAEQITDMQSCDVRIVRSIQRKLETFDPSPGSGSRVDSRGSPARSATPDQRALQGPKSTPFSIAKLTYIQQQYEMVKQHYQINAQRPPKNITGVLYGLARSEEIHVLASRHSMAVRQINEIVDFLNCSDVPIDPNAEAAPETALEIGMRQPNPKLDWRGVNPTSQSRSLQPPRPSPAPAPAPAPAAVGMADVDYLDLQMEILLSLDTTATGGYSPGIYARVLYMFDEGQSDEAISASMGLPTTRLRQWRQILGEAGTPTNAPQSGGRRGR